MSLNSVNTNLGAMVALQSLNHTSSEMATTQKRISTGLRVADATDDGAAYAVAQRIRGDVGSLTSANEQLGNVKGVLSTTISGLNNVSNAMNEMKKVLVKLSDGTVTGDQRAQYTAQYNSFLANVKTFFQDSSYNGKTLIGNLTGSSGNFAGISTIRNESGATYGIATFGGSAVFTSLGMGTAAAGITAGAAVKMLSYTSAATQGAFVKMAAKVGTALNQYGNASRYVDSQMSFNNDKMDSLKSGLGYLVDADLSKEAAQLQALQTRQQLGTQSLSIANQAPQSLLSLFR